MMRLFIFLSVWTAFFHPSITSVVCSQSSDAGAMLRDRVTKWSAWSKQFGDYTVTVDTGIRQEKPRVNLRTIQRNRRGDVCVRLAHSDDTRSDNKDLVHKVIIQNSSYSAQLAKGLDDEWVLVGLAISGEPDYEQRLRDEYSGPDWFKFSIIEMPAHFLPLVLDQAGYTVTATDETLEETGAGTAYTLEFKPGYLKVAPFYTMLRLHFANSGIAPAVQIDYALVDERRFSRVFRNWTKAGGLDVPGMELTFMPEFPVATEPYAKTEFDYANYDAPFDTATCYLTYYGLPEPSEVSESNVSMWMLVGLGAVLMILGFVVRRRASRN